MKHPTPQAGFTLIEILLVTLLLFMLSYATFMAIRSTMSTKRSIDSRTEILQSGRALIELMDRDLRNVFFIDASDLGWNPSYKDPAQSGGPEGEGGAYEGDYESEAPPPKPVPITIFQATKNELLFSSRSHQRMSADSPENEQHFVRYRTEGKKLIREESFRAISKDDITDEKQFRSTELIDNLKKIEFEFWNEKAQRWEDRWDTNSSEFLDVLPESVKVLLVYVPEALNEGEDATKEVEYQTTIRLTQSIFKKGPVKQP